MNREIIPDELFVTIGRNLHTIRNARKETLEVAAEAAGTTHPVLSKIENGRYPGLNLVMLIKLCNHYNATLQEILELQITQIFHFTQKNESGAHNFKQYVVNEVADGFQLLIEQLKSENAHLRSENASLLEIVGKKNK